MSQSGEPVVQVKDTAEEGEPSGAEAMQEKEQLPRRSQRILTLTEKGKGMQDSKIKALQQRFSYIYDKWRVQAKSSKQSLSKAQESLSEDLLNDIIGDVSSLSTDIQRVYKELR